MYFFAFSTNKTRAQIILLPYVFIYTNLKPWSPKKHTTPTPIWRKWSVFHIALIDATRTCAFAFLHFECPCLRHMVVLIEKLVQCAMNLELLNPYMYAQYGTASLVQNLQNKHGCRKLECDSADICHQHSVRCWKVGSFTNRPWLWVVCFKIDRKPTMNESEPPETYRGFVSSWCCVREVWKCDAARGVWEEIEIN